MMGWMSADIHIARGEWEGADGYVSKVYDGVIYMHNGDTLQRSEDLIG
jgi:hypothetical protein